MANKIKFGSAGVTAVEIDKSGPAAQSPSGVPAGIIGTSNRGPAFVPITVGNIGDFYAKFGTTDAKKFGPIAAAEWLRNAQALTYLRVLGVGNGLKRDDSTGTVLSGGFVVGEELPDTNGKLASNPYANSGGPPGRTYFLGCAMSASNGLSPLFTEGFQSNASAIPVLRGIIMAPSGVVITLSSSLASSSIASPNTAAVSGSSVGSVQLSDSNSTPKAQFALLLNGHQGTVQYPNVVTASFLTSSGGSYFATKLNTDPYKIQEAGHYLHSYWDVPGFEVTGSGIISASLIASSSNGYTEPVAFILTGALGRNISTSSAGYPNFESFENRFTAAKSPWVISQRLGGKPANLFRFHALDDGAGFSTKVKVSIESITPSADPANQYGTFDVVIRDWNDTDADKKVLERFSGLSLDPSSNTYIAKAIGNLNVYFDFDRAESDQKLVVEGDYSNVSNYVRVEVSDEVVNGYIDPAALPMGYRGIYHTVTSGSALNTNASYNITGSSAPTLSNFLKGVKEPPLPFNVTVYKGTTKKLADSSQYWGAAFQYPSTVAGAGTQLGNINNNSVKTFAGYLPDFRVDSTNFFVGDNTGEANGPNGVVDADLFNYNLFTLENVAVYTSSLNSYADPQRWAEAEYHRTGGTGSLHRNFKVTDLTTENRRFAKFTMLMQGGFDGVNLFNEDEANLTTAAVDADMTYTTRGSNNGPNVRTYAKALDVMKNTVNADIQLLAIPGIRNEYITNRAIADVEQRFDAMYVMDIPSYDGNAAQISGSSQQVSVSTTTQAFVNRAINTSFAAAYFPDVSIIDPTLNVAVDVPPSVAVLGALALNDAVGHPWFAPAGFTRGSLPTTLETKVKLSKLNQDVLYDANINPLVQFTTNPVAGTGPTGNVVVWGQKTLMQSASALDRVNVRRLLIEIRRQVRDIAQTILFEPNRATTLARFSAAITPRLQRIQQLAGLEKFKVVIDSSTTTQDDVMNNTIRGKIYVVPTRTVEFVSLDFVVANNIQQ